MIEKKSKQNVVLLIQSRSPRDPMLDHERACFAKRLADQPVRLVTRNAVSERAEPSWLRGVHGLILGGSGDYSVHHPFSDPWLSPLRRLLDMALQRDLPGFGVCFGHQLLSQHLGAAVRTDPEGEEVGSVDLQLTQAGQDCELFGDLGLKFSAQTGHADTVDRVPIGAELLAEGERVACQALRVIGAPFWSTQFHPDLTGSEARERFLSNKTDADGHVSAADQLAAEAYRVDAVGSTDLLDRWARLLVDPD